MSLRRNPEEPRQGEGQAQLGPSRGHDVVALVRGPGPVRALPIGSHLRLGDAGDGVRGYQLIIGAVLKRGGEHRQHVVVKPARRFLRVLSRSWAMKPDVACASGMSRNGSR